MLTRHALFIKQPFVVMQLHVLHVLQVTTIRLKYKMGKVTKQWKNDGEEDNKLRSLLTKGKINKFTKPVDLQKDYPEVFGSFSLQVMRNHLNAVKRTNGLYRKCDNKYSPFSFVKQQLKFL